VEIRKLIEDRIAAGAEVVTVQISQTSHPLARYAGMLKDDPLLEPWKQAMAEYRDRETTSDLE
jgi:hypothetical protein